MTSNVKPLEFFDNTRLNALRECERKYYYRHVRHWAPDAKKPALAFGSAWHSAMDILWGRTAELYQSKQSTRVVIDAAYEAFIAEWTKSGFPHPDELGPDELDDLAPRTPQVALEMLHAYVPARQHIFTDPSFKLLAIEKPFAVPLAPDDDTTWYIGRLDKVFSYRSRVIGMETKTTTSYKKDGYFRSDFVDDFMLSSQITGYNYALRMEYGDLSGGIWIDGALVHKSIHEGFIIIPEARSHDALDEFLWTVWTHIDSIRGNLKALEERRDPSASYMAAFPKRTTACGNYGGCPFRSICSVVANPEKLTEPPLGFIESRWSPFEIVDLKKLGFSAEQDAISVASSPAAPTQEHRPV